MQSDPEKAFFNCPDYMTNEQTLTNIQLRVISSCVPTGTAPYNEGEVKSRL